MAQTISTEDIRGRLIRSGLGEDGGEQWFVTSQGDYEIERDGGWDLDLKDDDRELVAYVRGTRLGTVVEEMIEKAEEDTKSAGSNGFTITNPPGKLGQAGVQCDTCENFVIQDLWMLDSMNEANSTLRTHRIICEAPSSQVPF